MMTTFAVEIEIPVRRILIVDAETPAAAVDSLHTEDGWHDATWWADDSLLDSLRPGEFSVLETRRVD